MSTSGAESAEEITKASGSNLALAFFALPAERRRDITTFYAFCRVIDDIADDPKAAADAKREGLARWRLQIDGEAADEPLLASEVRGIVERYGIDRQLLHEIIAGVEMDIEPCLYADFEGLRVYCHRVASAVGLVSIEIFGYMNPGCRRYARDLGMALQITNIIRDVGQDLENGGRIYLPMQDLARFGISEGEFRKRVPDDRFRALLEYEAQRARLFFHSALVHLPDEDRASMIAAQIMGAIYSRLLRKMERDGFRVLDRRYALNPVEKVWVVARSLVRNAFRRRERPSGEAAAK